MREILYSGYIDRVALDIKAPLDIEHYSAFSNYVYSDVWSIETCLKVCKKLGIEMEVRTTIAPDISDSADCIERVGLSIKGLYDVWYLQQYSNEGDILDPEMKKKPSPSRDKMIELANVASNMGLKNVFIKTRTHGLERIS